MLRLGKRAQRPEFARIKLGAAAPEVVACQVNVAPSPLARGAAAAGHQCPGRARAGHWPPSPDDRKNQKIYQYIMVYHNTKLL